jgi:hypothetical protein
MLLLGSSFGEIPLLSLRTGSAIGSVVGHLINPHTLKVDALWVRIGGFKQPFLLLIQDIREVSLQGIVINDHDVAIEPSEALRLKPIIDLNFELIDKKVVSSHLPIGKVADYALNKDSFMIEKLYVEPTVWKKLQANRLTIDRTQIIEVSHTHVRVKGTEIKESTGRLKNVPQSPLSSAPPASASVTEE